IPSAPAAPPRPFPPGAGMDWAGSGRRAPSVSQLPPGLPPGSAPASLAPMPAGSSGPHLPRQRLISLRSPGATVVEDNGLAEAGRLAQAHVARDDGLKHPHFLGDIPPRLRAREERPHV